MKNNIQILRQAAFDLYSVDSKDIVKSAAVVKKLLNFVKGFGDPEFRSKLKELQELSPEVKRLSDQLSVEIGRFNKAISNLDPEQFQSSLENVKPLVSELSKALNSLELKAQQAEAEVPIDGLVNSDGEVISGEDIKRLDKGWKKNEKIFEAMKSMLPESLDVPIQSHINKDMQDFEWFRQFEPQNIRFSDKSSEWIIDSILNVIFNSEGLAQDRMNAIIEHINRNKLVILNNLRNNILNGVLRAYTFPTQGQPNRMTVLVDAGTVQIPGLDFEVQFPTIFLSDKLASISPVKELDVVGVKNVKPFSPYKEQAVELDASIITSVLDKNDWNIAATARELGTSDRSLRRKMQEFGINRPEEEDLVQQEVVPQEPQQTVEEPVENQEVIEEVQEPQENLEEELSTISSRIKEFEKLANTNYNNIHEWARNVIQKAFYNVMNRYPSESEIQAVQAVAHLESSYGRGWKGSGKGSNNWGAIQCGNSCKINGRCNPATSFEHRDSTPQDDGTTKWYVTCFKKYPTPEDGAADLIRTLFLSERKAVKGSDKTKTRGQLLQEAAARGDLRGFSEAMYDTVYYEGTGKDKETRVSRHMSAMQRALDAMSKESNREIAMVEGGNNKNMFQQTPQMQSEFDKQDAQQLFNFLFAAGPIEKMVRRAIYKKALPTTKVLISVGSTDVPFHARVRFARILTSALRAELDAESSVHSYGNKIEIESDISGSEKNVALAARGLSEGLSDAFELSTEKCGENSGYKISTRVFSNVKSAYALIDSKIVETCFRKFAFDMVSK